MTATPTPPTPMAAQAAGRTRSASNTQPAAAAIIGAVVCMSATGATVIRVRARTKQTMVPPSSTPASQVRGSARRRTETTARRWRSTSHSEATSPAEPDR